MAQGNLPPIHGADWKPENPLSFVSNLPTDAARTEVLRFIAERHDGHLQLIAAAWDHVISAFDNESFDGEMWHTFSQKLCDAIETGLVARINTIGLEEKQDLEVVPRRDFNTHLGRRAKRFLIDLKLCLRRLAHYMSITIEQRLEWHKMMLRTRYLDGHLKEMFMSGMETPDGGKFGGKGFRSTWQEPVVAVASALSRESTKGVYSGDIVGPMIRDVGLCLAMGDTVLGVLAAQSGKANSNQDGGQSELLAGGRDLHVGAWGQGVLPPFAPLPISACTMTGLALGAKLSGTKRFQVACIGEGASSSGEYWEALNFASTRALPLMYILENNQIALDTPNHNQSNVELWADKAVAMGMPSWTIDGSDPAAWYASAASAREYSMSGAGPTLLHVETMRGCGHAHHHDDLYLGTESGNPPGYVDRDLLAYWAAKDPLPMHKELLINLGAEIAVIEEMERTEQEDSNAAMQEVIEMPWPDPETVTLGITSLGDAEGHADHLQRISGGSPTSPLSDTHSPPSSLAVGELLHDFGSGNGAWTYARAIQQAMVAIANRYGEKTVFMGEDMEIAGAFGMNLPLKNAGHSNLLLDMPLSEAIIIHSATGAALSGMRPMAEIQFGGFTALAFNALINNAAMLRWRWGAEVPLTVRIPLGGKTRSGPFHANMIESWFTNDPGLIICAPSNPQDAYDLLVESAALNDPVIFLEHIGLYGLRGGKTGWGDDISQKVNVTLVESSIDKGESYSIGKAKVIRGGADISLVTWGSMTHVALHAAEKLAEEKGIEVEIIDLRTLLPFDAKTCVESVNKTGRLVILQEGQWTGGFGHTIQSRIMEETFFSLESMPVVIGALDTPVPFSPPLEDHTIPDVEHVYNVISQLCK